MTPEYRLTQIIETIRAIRIGAPVSKGGVTLLLEPWPDLYWEAMEREWAGAIDEHLERAAVILLLVSADFLASDYCYDESNRNRGAARAAAANGAGWTLLTGMPDTKW
jgi:hypothetical protein